MVIQQDYKSVVLWDPKFNLKTVLEGRILKDQ